MSNPDKDFPNDPDRFTPLQDVPDLQNPEVMPDPVMDRHLTSWAQQVEAESMAGPEEKPSSLPWPPLSQEQVVELHEALATFSGQMATASPGSSGDMAVVQAADELWLTLRALHIGTPQPPPRQEENLGGFACLDERRMGPPAPLGAYTGPPVEMVPIPAYSGAEPVDVPLTQKAVERTYPCRECGKPRTKAEGGTTFTVCDECWDKVHPMRTSITPTPEVKHNCWTCASNQPPRNNCPINGRLDVAMWVGSTHGWTMDGMPPKDSDGCPGWTPKA